MKKLVTLAVLAGALAIPMAATAGNSYGTQPGFDNAIANSNGCAGHGAFGAFGKDNNFAGGASGDRTAFNNSTLCGNPQGAAGTLDPTP